MTEDTTTPLAAQACVPCRGGVPPLDAAAVEALRGGTPDWTILDGSRRIERRYRFKTFAQAFAFVRDVADLAEAEGHHPDISFGWGYATLSLQTHAIGGLHRNDFILAAKIDRATTTR